MDSSESGNSKKKRMSGGEIVVAAYPHPGHLFPAVELANQMAAKNYDITLLFPSSTPTSSFTFHPMIRVEKYPLSHSLNFSPPEFEDAILDLIGKLFDGRDPSALPICAVVDDMVSWLVGEFSFKFNIPAASLFTSSATSAALEHAMNAIPPDEARGKILAVPGLPEEMALTPASFASRRGPPPHHHHHHRPPPGDLPGRGGGPPPHHYRPPPGDRPRRGRGPRRSLAAPDRTIAFLFNTCEELERPFIDYIAKVSGKMAVGVGPLVRSKKGAGDVSGGEVIEWLDSKPRGSVIYVAFGSLVSPSDEELAELAAGLEASSWPFIWAFQPGGRRHGPGGAPAEDGAEPYFPSELAGRVGSRGLVIRGWAPQLEILGHPSTGGYVCHCGWNSTLEALGCGVPMLTWPVRGDQLLNARLVTDYLKVGLPIKVADDVEVKRGDIVGGIERLMTGEEDIKKRALSTKSALAGGLPESSSASLDRFLEFAASGNRLRQME